MTTLAGSAAGVTHGNPCDPGWRGRQGGGCRPAPRLRATMTFQVYPDTGLVLSRYRPDVLLVPARRAGGEKAPGRRGPSGVRRCPAGTACWRRNVHHLVKDHAPQAAAWEEDRARTVPATSGALQSSPSRRGPAWVTVVASAGFEWGTARQGVRPCHGSSGASTWKTATVTFCAPASLPRCRARRTTSAAMCRSPCTSARGTATAYAWMA